MESGQQIITQLLREPVKEAVREALAEERDAFSDAEDRDRGGEERATDEHQPTDEESSGPPAGIGVALLAAVGIAYLLRRRQNSDDSDVTRPSNVDEQTAAGDRVEEEAPVKSED